MESAKLMRTNLKDILKGFLLATIMMIVTGLYKAIETGAFPSTWAEWRVILLSGLGGGLAYLIKNFFTNSDGKFLSKEKK